ncbi:unnamed protein product, partial [Meganyctiphanes norvegica]
DSQHRWHIPKLETPSEDFRQLGNCVPMQQNSWHTPQVEAQPESCTFPLTLKKKLEFSPCDTRYSKMKMKRPVMIKSDSGFDFFININKDVIQNPQNWEKIMTSRNFRTESQNTVKTEPSNSFAIQDRSLINTLPYIKPDLSEITKANLLINRNNIAPVNVKSEFNDNSLFNGVFTSGLQQGSPKRIKLELQRPRSPTLFKNTDSIKQESQ